MGQELNQVLMIRSKLRNKYVKYESEIDKQRCNKQRNYCLKLMRLEKQKYHESLDINKITDNKPSGRQQTLYFQVKIIRQTPE